LGGGTALAVSGVSVCILGLIVSQLNPFGAFLGLVLGIGGVAISFIGVVEEADASGWHPVVEPRRASGCAPVGIRTRTLLEGRAPPIDSEPLGGAPVGYFESCRPTSI